MAYTQAMDETTPSGADAASTADDQLRALKRDIKERLNSVFVDYNSDPLTLRGIRLDSTLGALYVQKNNDAWIAGLRPVKHTNGIILGNGDDISFMIDSRTTALAAHIDNNNKIYFLSGFGLVVHYNSTRFGITASGISSF